MLGVWCVFLCVCVCVVLHAYGSDDGCVWCCMHMVLMMGAFGVDKACVGCRMHVCGADELHLELRSLVVEFEENQVS